MAHSTKILVFHVPAGGGHRAAARALAEAAEARRVGCEVVNALDLTPPWFARAYVGAHLRSTEHTPAFYGHGYAALNQRRALVDGVRGVFDRAVGARLLRHVDKEAPDVIVSTHFFPLAVLGHARLRGELAAPLVGVVTDYAAHAFWAEPGVDRFCMPAGRAMLDLVRHGIRPETIVATGIPIREAFGAIAPLTPPAADGPLSVLITSGGFGVGPMIDVIRSFAGIPRVRLTIQAQRAAALSGVTADMIGFESDMPRRMAAAHVIVGKPGGLTVSESLAAGRPMVLVGACPGQEMMNQRWMIERGAAVAAEPSLAGRTIGALRDQGALASLAQVARSLAAPRAATRVLDVALRLANSALLTGGRDGFFAAA